MTFKLYALLLMASRAFASPLCTPDQFEVMQIIHAVQSTGQSMKVSFVHYDYKNTRLAATTNQEVNGDVSRNLIVELYSGDTGTQYTLDLDSGTCVTTHLNTSFRRACLPDNATHAGNARVGNADDGTIVSFYVSNTNDLTIQNTVTKPVNDTISPVNAYAYNPHGAAPILNTVEFYNMTIGITYPSIFDVPPGCKKTNIPSKSSISIFGF